LVENRQTGLFFPTGDAPMLAARLRKVFEGDGLAVRLGNQAHEIAIRRHDPNKVVHEVLATYEDVLVRSQ